MDRFHKCHYASIKQLLVPANMESYNAILINQGKDQPERMTLLRQLAVQQLKTLDSLDVPGLPLLEEKKQNNRISKAACFSELTDWQAA